MEEPPSEAEVWEHHNRKLAKLHQEMEKEFKINIPRSESTTQKISYNLHKKMCILSISICLCIVGLFILFYYLGTLHVF